MMLELVDHLDEVTSNCATMASYLHSEVPTEVNFAKDRIAKGACFLVVGIDGELNFFPSRFLGYKNNSIEMHLYGSGKLDGKLTNPTISKLLKSSLVKTDECDVNYLIFCGKYGIRASHKRRSYWILGEKNDQIASGISAFSEGRAMLKEIRIFQRSSALVKLVKAIRKPTCECCNFNFHAAYGDLAEGYIECHHLDPVSKRAGNSTPTTPADVALLCANCHRMVHRTREGLTLDELQAEMKKANRAKRT